MTKKTISLQKVKKEPDKECPLYHTEHSLNDCRAFIAKPIEERRRFVKENDICFKCCESTKHARKTCRKEVKCAECNSNTHPSALHVSSQLTRTHKMAEVHGEEQGRETGITVHSKCTQICRDVHCTSKSCSKTVLVKVYCEESPENAVKLYAIIDDQSNRSLVKSELLDTLQFRGGLVNYVLTSCAGSLPTKGRHATGLIVQSLDGSLHLKLPTLIECNSIPDVRSEIPTPDVARSYPHLLDIARFIPNLDDSSNTLLLIGRDLLEAHHVLDQRLGLRNTPFVQRLHLGWVIVGEACHNKTHKPKVVNVNKINILGNGRPSLFLPCNNSFEVKETSSRSTLIEPTIVQNAVDQDVFIRSIYDEKIGFFEEDRQFIRLMDEEFRRDCDGSWKAPLPLKKNRQKLPNNKPQAVKRATILANSLRKNDNKRQHFTTFMEKIFNKEHAGPAEPLEENKECWYLPLFGVYHPKKPDQIRGVFDSSSTYNGISLNDVLLQGPD